MQDASLALIELYALDDAALAAALDLDTIPAAPEWLVRAAPVIMPHDAMLSECITAMRKYAGAVSGDEGVAQEFKQQVAIIVDDIARKLDQ